MIAEDAPRDDTRTHLDLLLRANDVLGRSLEYRETLQNVAEAAVATIADLCLIDLGEPGMARLVGAARRDGGRSRELEEAGLHLESVAGRPPHPVCEVLVTGAPVFVPRLDERWIDERATRPEHAAFMRAQGYTSLIVVPLRSQIYGVTGALTLVTLRGGRPRYRAEDVEIGEALARMCASAIGKARLYDEAYATAVRFQEAALPRIFPQNAGIEFFSYYQPAAEHLLVGGDWYDAFPLPDGRIGVCIGDAEGHGLSACVLMASVRNALRTALIMEPDIDRALDAVDFLVRTEYGGRAFCTAVLGILDPDAMTLRIGAAGHPGPKIWDPRTGRVVDPFSDRDLPLGLRDLGWDRARPKTIRLEGGLAVFYTDGLIECERDPVAGDARLEAAIRDPAIREAADPAAAIREGVGCATTPDDVAILVARFG